MSLMRRYCEFGLHIVQGIPHLERAAEVIRCHHARMDGHGHPAGLCGKQIPLVARIFAVADTWDAMTSDRPYRRGCSFPKAAAEVRLCAGSQFDPVVVSALDDILDELEEWRRNATFLRNNWMHSTADSALNSDAPTSAGGTQRPAATVAVAADRTLTPVA